MKLVIEKKKKSEKLNIEFFSKNKSITHLTLRIQSHRISL
jgi:hypothetical protein